jgi:hypothetical protein
VMLLAPAGAALLLWRQGRRRDSTWVAVVPLASVLGWGVYVRSMIGAEAGGPEILEIGWPFVGFVQAFGAWLRDPIDLVVGVALMAILFTLVWRTMQSDHLVAWAFAGFALVAMLLTEPVWRQLFNSTRAVAPALTAFVLVVFATSRPAAQRTSVRP